MSSGEVGWFYKGRWLNTTVLLSTRDYGVPARGLLCAVVVEHEYPGQGLRLHMWSRRCTLKPALSLLLWRR